MTTTNEKLSPDHDPMLSFAKVARRLGVSGHMVRELADAGEIHSFRPGAGKNRRVWQSELERFMITNGRTSRISDAVALV